MTCQSSQHSQQRSERTQCDSTILALACHPPANDNQNPPGVAAKVNVLQNPHRSTFWEPPRAHFLGAEVVNISSLSFSRMPSERELEEGSPQSPEGGQAHHAPGWGLLAPSPLLHGPRGASEVPPVMIPVSNQGFFFFK